CLKIKIQQLKVLLSAVNKPTLAIPHYSEGCGINPTKVYQRNKQLISFSAALSSMLHIFNAEAVDVC
ncbi:predicted protein, partial [Histoplasma mississippiense (nom. inval.)]|uniref:predicted protein n=1 Tax=Ajellomyces capsulatus (strain NAm1 / WU24) TaxID=2059318 RepID=UPI000157D677